MRATRFSAHVLSQVASHGTGKFRVAVAAWVLFVGVWITWAPGAAAQPVLVDAVASLSASADNGTTDETGDVFFSSEFNESVVSNFSGDGAEHALASQNTTLEAPGGILAEVSTRADVESSASGGSDSEACCATGDARLDVEFSIDAPRTILIAGVIGSNHTGQDCSLVSLTVQGSGVDPFEVDDGVDCGTQGVPSELTLNEPIHLDAVGNYSIQLNARSNSVTNEASPSSDGLASWNLRFAFCSNDFTDGPDVITGTDQDDVLCGGGGKDEIDGGLGNDTILGGLGDDTLTGGTGDDTLEGAEGRDILHGGDNNDILRGGPGDDGDVPGDLTSVVDGGAGRDVIEGGTGNDFLYSAEFNGGASIGDGNDDNLSGGPGKDLVSAFEDGGENTLNGDGGDDTINGGEEPDNIGGGDDHDKILAAGGNDTVVHGGSGDDLMEGGKGNDVLRGESGSDKLRGKGDNDCLIGGNRKDVFVGGAGNDKLLSRDGVRDELHGGPNFDRARVDHNRDDLIGIENDNFQGGCP